MSANDAAKKVKGLLAGGRVPSPSETLNTLKTAAPAAPEKSEPSVQLNLRVPASVKKRVRVLAARDGLTLSEIVMRGVDLYEEASGSASAP